MTTFYIEQFSLDQAMLREIRILCGTWKIVNFQLVHFPCYRKCCNCCILEGQQPDPSNINRLSVGWLIQYTPTRFTFLDCKPRCGWEEVLMNTVFSNHDEFFTMQQRLIELEIVVIWGLWCHSRNSWRPKFGGMCMVFFKTYLQLLPLVLYGKLIQDQQGNGQDANICWLDWFPWHWRFWGNESTSDKQDRPVNGEI